MKVVKASATIQPESMPYDIMLQSIENSARNCYKSEKNIKENSAEKMVLMLIKRGHEAMLEHGYIKVTFICDRGISHELVRHRLFSPAQESTRYCNYGKDDIEFVLPFIWANNLQLYRGWKEACALSEVYYKGLLSLGQKPEWARSVLNNSLKTEVDFSGNPRMWREFFKLRCDSAAHPQMRELTIPLLAKFIEQYPALFSDIGQSLLEDSLIPNAYETLKSKGGVLVSEEKLSSFLSKVKSQGERVNCTKGLEGKYLVTYVQTQPNQ